MKLLDLLQNGDTSEWKKKNYFLPEYDRKVVKQMTREEPEWVHFGAGNIFRAFTAESLQRIYHRKI